MRCDEDMFVQMYAGIYQDLYRYALCVLGHTQEAEDAVSEAVMAAYGNIRKLRKPEAFQSWIFRILSNVCKKRMRRQAKEMSHYGEEVWDHLAAEEPDRAEALDVRKAFYVLSEEERIIVGLSVFGGYNSHEIAEMLKKNANTIRSRRSRALKKMELVLK